MGDNPRSVRSIINYTLGLSDPPLCPSCCSVDARDRDFGIAERWSDDTVFSNRAYFMPDKQPAELGVDHIREEDAGIYRCRVDFQIGQTRNSKVNLTVIGESVP